MHWKLFADLAERAGEREVAVSVDDPDATVADALAALFAVHPDLEPRVRPTDESEGVADHITVLRNGVDVREAEGLATPVEADDELALYPPVSGG